MKKLLVVLMLSMSLCAMQQPKLKPTPAKKAAAGVREPWSLSIAERGKLIQQNIVTKAAKATTQSSPAPVSKPAALAKPAAAVRSSGSPARPPLPPLPPMPKSAPAKLNAAANPERAASAISPAARKARALEIAMKRKQELARQQQLERKAQASESVPAVEDTGDPVVASEENVNPAAEEDTQALHEEVEPIEEDVQADEQLFDEMTEEFLKVIATARKTRMAAELLKIQELRTPDELRAYMNALRRERGQEVAQTFRFWSQLTVACALKAGALGSDPEKSIL